MGNLIVFLIIAIVTIVKAVANYNKEKAKNKGRVITKPPLRTPQQTPPPFSKNIQTAPVVIPNVINEDIQESIVVIEESAVQAQMNKYQSIKEYAIEEPPMEGSSSLSESIAFANSDDEKYETQKSSFDLELGTPQDYKRAFVHSLIFERKY